MKRHWNCSTCSNQIVTYVELSEPPTCSNHHSIKQMEEKEKQNEHSKVSN